MFVQPIVPIVFYWVSCF